MLVPRFTAFVWSWFCFEKVSVWVFVFAKRLVGSIYMGENMIDIVSYLLESSINMGHMVG
jgi:hypothetical protein